jgi:hypothetical protein
MTLLQKGKLSEIYQEEKMMVQQVDNYHYQEKIV